MTPGLFALLVGAGVAAGLVGSIGGLASLFSYPALLAAGLPATSANVTNTVSLAVGSISTVTSSRPELAGQLPRVRRLGLICALGGAAGAGLLLVTPAGVFERIVPFLVAGASVAMLLSNGDRSPAGVDVTEPADTTGRRLLVAAGVLAVAVYGGYFGAAAGVLMLALLLTTLPESLIRVNALKNLLLGLSNVIAAVGFALFGPVSWSTALPLTCGLVLGAWAGPWVARRLPSRLLRIGIGLAGLSLAAKLGWNAF
ncbi:sulfite exporter TauE/SafE family protein [Pseudonocardia acaciae]|uniref:sulfite exporter TauE/SafE family protein n=1 Tax=Pseudonocardia acaciae TaxID=551276 RepID=UPI00048E7E30|nr:sulfite exporter TauE/SafE family protein [Pseudonocardia acaciae]